MDDGRTAKAATLEEPRPAHRPTIHGLLEIGRTWFATTMRRFAADLTAATSPPP